MACKSKKVRRMRKMQEGGSVEALLAAQKTQQTQQGIGQVAGFGGSMVESLTTDPETGLQSVGGGAASGALKGAGAGAMLGPVGMIGGALVGGIASAISAKKKNEAAAEQQRKVTAGKREAADPTQASYNPYAPLMPYGGKAGSVVELERGEPFRTPDGKIHKVSDKAPTHAQGGSTLWLPNGTEVLGKLDAQGGKQFKQLGSKLQRYQKKYSEANSNNPTSITANTSKLMLAKIQQEYSNLFQTQQMQNGNVVSEGGFAKGGKVKKAQGGMKVLPGYNAPEGISDARDFQSMYGLNTDNIWGPKTQGAWDQYGSTYMSNKPTSLTPMSGVVPNPSLESNRSTMTSPWGNNASPFMASGPPKLDPKSFDWGNALSTAGSLAPIAYNIGQGLKPAERLNYNDYLNPYISEIRSTMRNRRFDINPTLESNKMAQSTYNYNIRQAAPTKGSYMSHLQAGSLGRMRADASAYSQKRNVENDYLAQQAQMDAMLGQGVADRKFQVKDYNMRNEAAKRAMMATGLGQLSQYAQMQKLMKNQKLTDAQRTALLPALIYNYMYDPNNMENAFSFRDNKTVTK